MDWRIPLADIDFGQEEEEAVTAVLRSRWLTMGEVTRQFETEFAEYTGAGQAIAVTNCTAALHMAVLALDLGPGDEVILPSLTFVATASAVRYTGATPVFADITSHQDFGISVADIEAKITANTKAIIVVHYGGYACDMPAIMSLAAAHNLAVIEDAAHAPGATLEERSLGTWGHIGCFSFFSNKNLAIGEGGMLTTQNEELAQRLRLLRSHGMTSLTWDRHKGHAWSYDVIDLGYNYRIDEMRAAIGRAQLKKLTTNNQIRQALTRLYKGLLVEQVPEISVPYLQYRGASACHIQPILLPVKVNRKKFMDAMKDRRIQTSIHYPPVHQFTAYHSRDQVDMASLPLTEEISLREVTLPLYPTLPAADVEMVVTAVREALDEI
ncbi:MAG: DegT/DnrJ/EryC1/StrS family aminotransferase [Anaerolineae bacterium]